jgi:hypothetical protein
MLFVKNLFLGILVLGVSEAAAQAQKGTFFSFGNLAVNFCQIDGDQAAGYNKFGYTASFQVGQGLGNNWVYETGIGYSVRGSRRPYNPDNPALQTFNLDYQMVDVPVKLVKYLKNYCVGAGIITSFVVAAEDKENYILRLADDTRKVNVLGTILGGYKLTNNLRATVALQYSLSSIRVSNNSGNPFFRTGVYHNVISLGIDFNLSSAAK